MAITKYSTLKFFFDIYDQISPKYPSSIEGRISKWTLHFVNFNKGTMSQRFRNSIYNIANYTKDNTRDSTSGDLKKSRSKSGLSTLDQGQNNNNNSNNENNNNNNNSINNSEANINNNNNQTNQNNAIFLTQTSSMESGFGNLDFQLREEAINDQMREGRYERYFNTIAYRKVVILVLAAVILEAALNLATFAKFGNYVFIRDFGVTTELIVTILSAITVIIFPKTTSRVQVMYLFVLLLTNNLTRLMWVDWFPPYEPTYQMFIWINLALPTAKFSRSTLTGTLGILSIVIIRIIQHYDTVANIIVTQGGPYLLYLISAAFGQRLIEIANRALFAELVNVDPFQSPLKLYYRFHRYYIENSSRLTLKFKSLEMEQAFYKFYGKESTIEVGVVLSTVVTSVYYVIQDIHYARPGTLPIFLALRFGIIIPATVSLLYLSLLRKRKPFKADFFTLLALIVIDVVQTTMYTQTSNVYGSYYYFGGVMRVLTLGSSQLFFLFLAVLLPFSFIIVPFSLVIFPPSANINYLLFLIIFVIIVASFSYLREQNQRLRFLVKYHAKIVLEATKNDTIEGKLALFKCMDKRKNKNRDGSPKKEMELDNMKNNEEMKSDDSNKCNSTNSDKEDQPQQITINVSQDNNVNCSSQEIEAVPSEPIVLRTSINIIQINDTNQKQELNEQV